MKLGSMFKKQDGRLENTAKQKQAAEVPKDFLKNVICVKHLFM